MSTTKGLHNADDRGFWQYGPSEPKQKAYPQSKYVRPLGEVFVCCAVFPFMCGIIKVSTAEGACAFANAGAWRGCGVVLIAAAPARTQREIAWTVSEMEISLRK